MKKQNKPIGLIVALGVFVLAAAGINAFQNGLIKLPDPRQNQAAGQARTTETTAKDVASDVKGKLGDLAKPAPPKAPANKAASMMLQSRNGRPLMALDNGASAPIVKPKPNDSSISTQWYSRSSRTD